MNSFNQENNLISPPVKGGIKEEMERFLNNREKREAASLSFRINPDLLDKEIKGAEDEKAKELLGLFKKLPENINFQLGTTLIVGYNATGKSTLAKAIFLACKKEKTADSIRETGAMLDKEERFRNADESAKKSVFDNPSGYEEEWIRSSGLASNLGRALEVGDFYSSTSGVNYADFQEINGKIKSRYDGMGIANEVAADLSGVDARGYRSNYGSVVARARREHMENVSKQSKKMGSTRQTVEKSASQLIHGDFNEPGPGVYFLDEPESGLDPFKKKNIGTYLDEMVGANDLHKGSIMIIPTNSTKLYESDLPRIDLRFPERGIFKPGQFPGYFEE